MADERLRESVISRRELHTGTYLGFRIDEVADADGRRHKREVVIHPGGVAVVALLDGGRLLLVRQYRHPTGEILLELPAGTLDHGADGAKEDPRGAVARELGEETGYEASEWRELGSFYTAPGFATEVMHLYLATGLSPIDGYAGPDTDERLEVVVLAWAEALAMAERAEIRDAKTLAGLYIVDRLAQRGEVPELKAS